MSCERCRLVACGIFTREIRWLIEKNRWPVDAVFLDSSLHVDFGRLEQGLTAALSRVAGEDVAVFYGACHPDMDLILSDPRVARTPVENCVEALLGRDAYLRELELGAFFLFEEWARRARPVILSAFGGSEAIAREVYQAERKYLLCVRTPCSRDFATAAGDTGDMLGLPLRWVDASLDHLESVLSWTIAKGMEGAPCPR
jgi:hypothetical protein